MPVPALKHDYADQRPPNLGDLSAAQYNLHAQRTDDAYDTATAASAALVTKLDSVQADQRYGSGDIFNWTAKNTRRLQRGMGKVLSGGSSDHLIIGDSMSTGYMGVQNYPGAWSRVARTLLNARGIPLGGTGWVFAGNSFPAQPIDPRWVIVSGAWLDLGYLYINASGATLTFTSELPGTVVSLAYLQQSGAFTVSIDGGAPVAPPINMGIPQVLLTYAVTGLPYTTHTITITTSSTNYTYIAAAQVSGASGLRIHNCSKIGESASRWGDGAWPQRSWFTNRLGLTPDVVHIALGVNDARWTAPGHTAAQYISDMTAICSQWPNSDVILYAELEPTAMTSSDSWATYISSLYQLATTLDRPLIDLNQRWGGSNAAGFANGNLSADLLHVNPQAHGDWGRLAANMILKPL